jgi:hypothetical protein
MAVDEKEIVGRVVDEQHPITKGEMPEGMTTEAVLFDELQPLSETDMMALQRAAEFEEDEAELVYADEDTRTLINRETGEVVGLMDTPPEEKDDIKFAEWIGERRAYHKAKVAGLLAERQVWLDQIERTYGKSIKRHEGAVKFLEEHNKPFLMMLAKRLIGDGKKRSAAVGLLLLKLIKTRAKTEILDKDKALAYLKKAVESNPELAEAIKTEESILTSKLPEDFKSLLVNPKNQEVTGIKFYAGGDDELKIE